VADVATEQCQLPRRVERWVSCCGHGLPRAPRRRQSRSSDSVDTCGRARTQPRAHSVCLSFLWTSAVVMSRSGLGSRGRIWSLVFACLIAVAAWEDVWAIATDGSSSELLIVAVDDDDSDGNAEHVPPGACGSVDHSSLWSSVRKPTACVEHVGLKNDSCLTSAPRGPPDTASNKRWLPEPSRVYDAFGLDCQVRPRNFRPRAPPSNHRDEK
jgi:hypothetical protein